MSKTGESLLRGAREAVAYVRGRRQGLVAHVPKRKALFVEELSDAELEAIRRTEVPVEYDRLNIECES